MKRYHLFCWYEYDASGGLGDYCGSFMSIDEAKAASSLELAEVAEIDDEGNLKSVCCREHVKVNGRWTIEWKQS